MVRLKPSPGEFVFVVSYVAFRAREIVSGHRPPLQKTGRGAWMAMDRAGVVLNLLRGIHRAGAWIFDRSGPLAPALARLGNPLHDRLFPHTFFVNAINPFPLQGLRIYHEGRPSYHSQMLAMGMHDRDVVRLLRKFITSGMTILDVGAHIGYFSLLSAGLAGPGGRVWAFEPLPDLLKILRKNIEENGFDNRIQVVPEAVSNVTGTATLYVNSAESMVSSLCSEAAADREPGSSKAAHAACPNSHLASVEVACTTLDAWAARQGWPPVDLIKIDIEGLEELALRGMVELSRRNPQMKLIIELNIRTLAAAGSTIEEFWNALRNSGFSSVSMAGRSLRPIEFPRDLRLILREISRQGNDRVNLFCQTATHRSAALLRTG